MKKLIRSLFLSLFTALTLFSFSFLSPNVMGQDSSCSNPSSLNLSAIGRCLADIQKAYDMSVKATQPLESELNKMQSQINGIKDRVSTIEEDLLAKEKSINESYKNLAKQEEILNRTIRDFYIKSYYNSPILAFLSQASASQITKVLTYQKAATDQDKVIITNIALSIHDLETKKKALQSEQSRLVLVREALDEESAKIGKIVSGAKAYQGTLSGQIAALSARQQEILTARSGTFTASIGDSELADDYNASIKGFREAAPSGYFAVFAFGAHTHRKGMSQYGARGRAQSGQDYKTILKAYYGKEPGSKDTGGDINVQGLGTMNFEERYLYGIAEMPSTWHQEALKAQAIAARTYALRYKQNGQSICTTETCQVFLSSKADNPPQAWKDAVNSTRGQTLEDVVTYYASTHGGFASPIGWDTTDGSGGGNFTDKSYDKLGGSPWLYKAWYTQGYSPSSNKCGRENPWLSPEELADIINAARHRDDKVTPITTSCWGGTPYSHEELRAKSNGPSSVSSVNVIQGNGTTNEVVFQTNIGEIKLNGSDFKTAFNIRAPGYLSIPQSGFAFYNIEKK